MRRDDLIANDGNGLGAQGLLLTGRQAGGQGLERLIEDRVGGRGRLRDHRDAGLTTHQRDLGRGKAARQSGPHIGL